MLILVVVLVFIDDLNLSHVHLFPLDGEDVKGGRRVAADGESVCYGLKNEGEKGLKRNMGWRN